MAYAMTRRPLGDMNWTGSATNFWLGSQVYVYQFTLKNVALRTPEDVKEVLRCVGGGIKNWMGQTIPFDICGITTSAVGAKHTTQRISVMFRSPDLTQKGIEFSLSPVLHVVAQDTIKTNALKLIRQTWPKAAISDDLFGYIVNNQDATNWWLRQPIMWALQADDVTPGVKGAPTQAFKEPTREQVLVGFHESPETAVPIDLAFRTGGMVKVGSDFDPEHLGPGGGGEDRVPGGGGSGEPGPGGTLTPSSANMPEEGSGVPAVAIIGGLAVLGAGAYFILRGRKKSG
jgi:hypothetical protein